MNYKKVKQFAAVSLLLLTATTSTACQGTKVSSTSTSMEETDKTDMFTDRDLSGDYDKSSATIVKLEDDYTIEEGGVYVFSGTLENGQIVVDAESEKVQIVLAGVDISCLDSACIYVKNADKVFVTLEEGTENVLTTSDTFEADGDTKVDGVIFSKSDLSINGTGSLEIKSEEGNGIVCKDELVIASGTYEIEASNHAIEANDRIAIADGDFTLSGGKDGIHCDNEDSSLGYIYIQDGKFIIEADSDGIDASSSLTIDGGEITVERSYEGLEASAITINDGQIQVVSSDDGINAAGGNENSLVINGGEIYVNANGDGLDANGSIEIAGGYIFISGPTDNNNSALDFDGEAIVTGGMLVATGSSGMVEVLGENSTQPSITVALSSYVEGEVVLKDSNGNEIISYVPEKQYNCITISSPDLEVGNTYTLIAGDTTQEIELTTTVYCNVETRGQMQGPGGMQGPGEMQGPGGMQAPGEMSDPRNGREDFPHKN